MFNFKKLIRSFRFAFIGIFQMFRSEQNARIHMLITLMVIAAAIILPISRIEWLVLLVVIGLVLMAEGVNTAIEHLANCITTEQHPEIKKAKDLAAGAVLIAAIIAALVGLTIFLPAIFETFAK